jgi:DNA-binding IclR family transcriptional regulator
MKKIATWITRRKLKKTESQPGNGREAEETEALRAELGEVLRKIRVLGEVEGDEELESLFFACGAAGVDPVNAIAATAVLTTFGVYLDIPWENIPRIIMSERNELGSGTNSKR